MMNTFRIAFRFLFINQTSGMIRILILLGVFCSPIMYSDDSGKSELNGWDESPYASILQCYVNPQGFVDYRGIKDNRENFDRFIQSIASLNRRVYDDWPKRDRLAFWINTYNALTVKAILDHYPIRSSFFRSFRYPRNSIQHISGVWDSISFPVMGSAVTLDEIENDILRKEFDEPRIHLALVKASKGAPSLRNEPYQGDRLETQWEEQVRRMLNDPSKFRIDERAKVIWISSLFDWVGKDFIAQYRDENQPEIRSEKQRAVIHFLSRYATDDVQRALRSYQYRIAYLNYDWSLNEQ